MTFEKNIPHANAEIYVENHPSEEELAMISRRPKPVFTALIIAITLLFVASYLYAGSVGRIKGTVTDTKTGEALFGVSVQIKGTTMGAKTNFDGDFVIISVPPGTYDLTFTAVGFEEVLLTEVDVSTDQTAERNMQMKQAVVDMGKVTTVTGKRKGIDFNQTGTVSIKTQKVIQVAPVATVDDLLARETGITMDAQGELHIRGGRSGETTYLVDGVNYSDPLGGRAPVDAGINISSSAVLELQVIKDGFDPEYGEALSGVVKITSPVGSAEKTRMRMTYYTDDFGSDNLNKFSENYDNLEFNISGPDPLLTSRILPALGIDYFDGKDFTYYIYGQVIKDDTRLPYWRYNTPSTRKTYSGFDLLGINIPDRQNNMYYLNGTLAFDPTSNMNAKLLFKGSWRKWTDFQWLHRYSPATAPVKDQRTNSVAFQLKQVISKSTDYEVNLSYWSSRFIQRPGDPNHPGETLEPDDFLFADEYENYRDVNNNDQFDYYEPFINIFPDSIKHGAIYIPNRNPSDITEATDDQVGGPWFPNFDLNNNGIMDQFEGEPFADINGNGVWDMGDELTKDVNGNGLYDEMYRDVTTPSVTSREEPYIDGDSSLGEPFTDINRNGVYDEGVDRFITALDAAVNQDLNRNNRYDGPNDFWEPGIPYIDYNNNGIFDRPNNQFDPGEPYVDINKNGKHDLGGDNNTAFLLYGFPQSGEANVWVKEWVDRFTAKTNFKKAIGRAHEIKAGFEYRRESIGVNAIEGLQRRNEDTLDGNPHTGRGRVRDFYERNPDILVLYFRDKIEYGSLVASLGLRADLFFQSSLKGTSTIQDQTGHSIQKIRNKLSPRVSINYPISERAMIRFNYGHFYELASYNRMYRNANPFQRGDIPQIGNPNLDYTKVVQYTFGVNYAFTDEYALKISGYYKDYFDIIATTGFEQSGITLFSYFDNTDYARSRAFELELTREASRFINGTLSYEYNFAYGKSSSDSENYEALVVQDEIAIDENPLNWDFRHRVALWLMFYFTDRDHPKLFGISIPNDWDMSLYWRFQTGFPYTPDRSFPGMVLDVGEKPQTNSMRLPSTSQTDIKLNKRFRVLGVDYTFLVWVNNIFNNRNVLGVYGTTGRADTSNNQTSIVHGGTEVQANPYRWGRGRQIIVGLSLQF
jgi:outer membrane receptor protein involved in Fe transport